MAVSHPLFHSARLRLTLWYLMTLLMVSLFFSFIIYNGATIEFRRALHQVEQRIELNQEINNANLPADGAPVGTDSSGSTAVGLGAAPNQEFDALRQRQLLQFRAAFTKDLEAIQRRVGTWLGATNGAIFFLAAVASYILAGRTLSPIQQALEKQKLFVADASHELKTPLTALKTNLEVALRDKALSAAEARMVLSQSLSSVNQLQELSEHLLSAARVEQAGSSLQLSSVASQAVITQVLAQLQPVIDEKMLKLERQTPPLTLRADEQSFKQMLMIFLDNAIKYTPPKGVIGITTQRTGRTMQIQITDSGAGIAAKDIPYIFDRFYRAEHSRNKTITRGYGLGLTLAKQIIDAHHGTVSVKSTPRKGATFCITLPL